MAIPAQAIDQSELSRAFKVTGEALKKAKTSTTLKTLDARRAVVMLDMASRYFNDASYFHQKGDFVNAFGALYYAHGWLDAGARLGFFEVGNDTTLFTVDTGDIP